jgi:hypothetical protein
MTIEARPFSLELPSEGSVAIGLIGTSRSGKSTLMKYLYKTHFKKHITYMATMNPHADIYKDMDPKIMTCCEYHPEILREFHELNCATGNKFPFMFISDDFVSPKIKNDIEITRALTIYRNSGQSVLMSFQGRTLMNAVGRNNLNYVAILKQQTPMEFVNVIKEYLDMYLPIGMNMKEKVEFCRLATEDHQFFFIDNIKGECYLTKLRPSQIS